MNKIELEAAITRPLTRDVVMKPALYAHRCETCGRIFDMPEYCNEMGRARIIITFDASPRDADGRPMPNTQEAVICSLACAAKLYDYGDWRKLPQFLPYRELPIGIVRVCVTPRIEEADLRARWAALEEREQPPWRYP